MKIEWVNHASFIVDDGEMRLITDPWIEGNVFNESWSLISTTKFNYEDFKNIDYIWFSHEHPDHFFPPNLKKIPNQYRKKIKIIFHKTKDQKVKKFCKSLGFESFYEINGTYLELSKQSKIYVEKFDNYSLDSWFYIKNNKANLLNINDCVLNSKHLIENLISKIGKVDYLFTQFSYANWVGNPKEKNRRRQSAKEKFERINLQIDLLKPKNLVPFASFVYFSHIDNHFMNETINTIRDTYDEFKSKVPTLIFYPGDVHTVGSTWKKNTENIQLYEDDLHNVKSKSLKSFEHVSIDEIKSNFSKGPFYNFNLKSFGAKILVNSIGLKNITINLQDIDKIITFDLINKNIIETDKPHDLSLNSQTLNYLLSFVWGPSTINIAGTFETQNKKGEKFINFMSEISQCLSNGERFNLFFSSKRFINLVYNKIRKSLTSMI